MKLPLRHQDILSIIFKFYEESSRIGSSIEFEQYGHTFIFIIKLDAAIKTQATVKRLIKRDEFI